MELFPALKISNRVIKGKRGDSHNSLGARLSIGNPAEHQRGFSPDGRLFLNRTQALGFLKKHDRKTYNELPPEAQQGLRSHMLAQAYGYVETPVEMPKMESLDLHMKKVLVVDRGLHTYCAEKLATEYGKVYFYLSEEDPYPNSSKASIGTGLKNVTRISDMWDYVDKVDLICFFDTNYGDLAHYLRKHGYRVFGSGKGENLELDKIGFLETLERLNLPCPLTYLAEGVDDALTYLEAHKNETLFLKCLRRGDFESKKFTSMPQIKPFFDDMKKRLGTAANNVEILIQHKIDSKVEAGIDTFTVDGKFAPNAIIGIEGKDVCFVAQVFDKNPECLQHINDEFAPVIKKLGFRGNWSTEVRITKDGDCYFIDPTPRQPEPPGALMTEIYSSWCKDLLVMAGGELPECKPTNKFGAQYILTSWWYHENEMHVSFPDKYKNNIKLKNHKVIDGEIYCVPNQNGEYWGSIVATGDTIKEAIDMIKEVAESIEADGFKFDEGCFDNILDSCEEGKKFGINFEF